ncbi:EGF-like domain, partial [Trinorchestia longiramus]
KTGSSLLSALEEALTRLRWRASYGLPLNLTAGEVLPNEPFIPTVRVVALKEIRHNSDERMSRLWLSETGKSSLELFIALNKLEVEEYTGLTILGSGLSRAGSRGCWKTCECCCSPRSVLSEGYAITQTSTATFVGPILTLHSNCKCISNSTSNALNPTLEDQIGGRLGAFPRVPEEHSLNDQRQNGIGEPGNRAPFAHAMRNKRINGKLVDCNENTCLNGGRCLPSAPGYKCVCPSQTSGPRCKILSRHFSGQDALGSGSWLWLQPLNPCSKLQLQLFLLTDSKNGTVLSTIGSLGNKEIGMVFQLRDGKPKFRLSLKSVSVEVIVNTTLADLQWHRVDIFWRNKTVEMAIDNCIGEPTKNLSSGD